MMIIHAVSTAKVPAAPISKAAFWRKVTAIPAMRRNDP